MRTRGFTLIELLMVIAIIGILSSVVLASLNSARNKGSDAAVKSTINNGRAQAELWFDVNNSSYTNVCTKGRAPINGVDNLESFMVSASQTAGYGGAYAYPTATSGTSSPVCNTNGSAWVMQVPLTSGFYCVDSTGKATTTGTDLIAGTKYDC